LYLAHDCNAACVAVDVIRKTASESIFLKPLAFDLCVNYGERTAGSRTDRVERCLGNKFLGLIERVVLDSERWGEAKVKKVSECERGAHEGEKETDKDSQKGRGIGKGGLLENRRERSSEERERERENKRGHLHAPLRVPSNSPPAM